MAQEIPRRSAAVHRPPCHVLRAARSGAYPQSPDDRMVRCNCRPRRRTARRRSRPSVTPAVTERRACCRVGEAAGVATKVDGASRPGSWPVPRRDGGRSARSVVIGPGDGRLTTTGPDLGSSNRTGTGWADGPRPNREGAAEPGGGDGTRTRNPLLAKQVRCQLRHAPRSGQHIRPGVSRRRPASGARTTGGQPDRRRRARPHGADEHVGDGLRACHRGPDLRVRR